MIRRARQRGVAMLLLAAILTIGVCAFLVTSLNSATFDQNTTLRTRNADALQQAKSALIGYVAKEALELGERAPGRLPCPETLGSAGTANEGITGGTCDAGPGSARTIGRLPWRTLGIDKLVDGANEPLWYVVSPSWVISPGPVYPVINPGKTGDLTADGTSDIVAIIIAPGRPLNINPSTAQIAAGCQARNQARNDRTHVSGSTTNPDHRDYLECLNASDPIDTSFGSATVDNATNPVINDQMVVITAKELLNAIQGPIAERMQRTVAPLLSEYSTLWPSGTLLPYAKAFAPPEDGLTAVQHCGTGGTREGLLPIAPSTGTCYSNWSNFAVAGSGSLVSCSTLPSTNVQCTFQYYTLSALGKLTLGSSPTYSDVTIQATAKHAVESFRKPLEASDVTVPAGTTVQSTTLNPQTDGDGRMSLVVRVSGVDLCDNTLLGVVCSVLALVPPPLNLIDGSATITVEFPQLSTPTLQGTKLSPNVLAFKAPPYNLLSPAADEPHYWFMQNEWYRYTYYAVAPSSTPAGTAKLTVTGFPSAFGSENDKRFVLALMGPAVTGQTRAAGAALSNYIEGTNAATSPTRTTFAYQVFDASGNDRIVTCPFTDGTTPCN